MEPQQCPDLNARVASIGGGEERRGEEKGREGRGGEESPVWAEAVPPL